MKYLNTVLAGFVGALINAYRRFISPMFPPSCRYQPTCSEYTLTAIAHHGAIKGVWLGLKRIGRCHPWGGEGFDPVPNADHVSDEKHVCKHI